MAEGAASLTMSGCPASPVGTNIPESYAPGLTMFWQGYVTDLRGCVPLEVHASRAARPIPSPSRPAAHLLFIAA